MRFRLGTGAGSAMGKPPAFLWLLIAAIGGLVLLVWLKMTPIADSPGESVNPRASVNEMAAPRGEVPQRSSRAPVRSPSAPGDGAALRNSTDQEEGAYVLEGGAEQIQRTPWLASLHRRLESESIDTSWAPFIETAVRDKMASQMSSGFRLLSVHCGATICEVQGVADSDEDSSAAYAAWAGSIDELKRVKSFELDQDVGVTETSATGRRVFVTFYSRIGGKPVYDPSEGAADGSAAGVK